MTDKSVEWLASSRTDLRALPEDARRALGFDLRRVQGGRLPRDWKPMPTVGAGVVEIRVRDASGAFRLMYVAKLADAIYVLHVFEKKSQKTAKLDLALAENRYATPSTASSGEMTMAIRVQRSSGNVFVDVGFSPEEAAHLLIRTDLMLQLSDVIEERGLTQKAAAKALGVTQPRVSDLVRGRVELFSIDTLVEMLSRFGVTVTLKTSRRRRRVA